MRIVSLLPSATDILLALGAADEVVGVSHSCGPAWAHVPRLTRTWVDTTQSSAGIDQQVQAATQPLYELNIEQLEALKPDVIVSQSLCEVCAIPAGSVQVAIDALSSRPLLLDLSPQRLHEVPLDFATVGEAIGRRQEAKQLRDAWDACFADYHLKHQAAATRIAFLDWISPPFAAGHWIPDTIEWLGGVSVLAQPGQPSHQIQWRDLERADPELVLAACCGFEAVRVADEALAAPADIQLLDGANEFSRPSPCLMQSLVSLDRAVSQYLALT